VIGSSSPVKRAPTVENYNRVFDENLNKKAAAPSGKNKILEWVIFLLPVILAILCIVAAAFLINENIKDTKDVHSAQRILARVNTNLNTQPITELE
jgi:flagellar basal body-associated protein FliL